jgi:branched-chain amino acid aminotransferase
MNVFFVIDGVALTPDLDGTILAGVTRDCVIQMLTKEGVKVEERPVSIDEVMEAGRNGKLQDAFGSGTAAGITQISHIEHKGELIALPPLDQRPHSTRLRDELDGIKNGTVPDRFGWTEKVKSKLLAEVLE